MALKCKKIGDDFLVDSAGFRLRFSKSQIGISSFAYLKGGVWHEAVNPSASGLLYLPQLDVPEISGEKIYPYHGGNIEVDFMGNAFAKFTINGYLSNSSQGEALEEFMLQTEYSIYEDGDIHLKTRIVFGSQNAPIPVTEEHILDPKDDNDITLECDTAPNLWFAGFHSNNTGDDASDLSHDGILIQYGNHFTNYVTYTTGGRKAVGLAKAQEQWADGSIHNSWFRMHLSANGSANDVTDSNSFQSVGDDKGADFRNPDPLTGGIDEGDVLTGSLSDDGFDEGEGTYTFESV
jgi:hypothetical protein